MSEKHNVGFTAPHFAASQVGLNILEKGGSEEPMELFKKFRGREPNVDALLRHSGIAA